MPIDPEYLSPNLLLNYEVTGKLARGCYGLVWKGRAYATGDRKYAIKVGHRGVWSKDQTDTPHKKFHHETDTS